MFTREVYTMVSRVSSIMHSFSIFKCNILIVTLRVWRALTGPAGRGRRSQVLTCLFGLLNCLNPSRRVPECRSAMGRSPGRSWTPARINLFIWAFKLFKSFSKSSRVQECYGTFSRASPGRSWTPASINLFIWAFKLFKSFSKNCSEDLKHTKRKKHPKFGNRRRRQALTCLFGG